MRDFLDVRIARRQEEAEGIISLELVDPAGGWLPPFEAGAHVEVQIAPGLSRHYSLCGSPQDRRCYRLGILREPASRGGSAQIHQGFVPGTLIRISLPRNQFRLEEQAAHSVLLGGGIGITPILAMAWRLHALGASFELHYCVRSRARVAFVEQLAQAPFAERITLHVDEDGRRLDIPTLLKGPDAQRHLYVCGPGGFMEAVMGEGKRQGWGRRTFTPNTLPPRSTPRAAVLPCTPRAPAKPCRYPRGRASPRCCWRPASRCRCRVSKGCVAPA